MIRATLLLVLAACTGEPSESKPPGETGDSAPPDCDTPWYEDADGDGYGDASVSITACEPPGGEVADNTDCDDDDALAYPGAPEDCTTVFDANCDGSTLFEDADLDGTAACEDCDDRDPALHPGAAEFCDGVDSDCDGLIDDAPADGRIYYVDADADGYGDVTTGAESCDAPEGGTADARDCDDTDAAVSPAGTEVCNGLDDDCNGTVDGADALDAVVWWDDADGDGWGDDPTEDAGCEAPEGSASVPDDCDDLELAVHPDASEVCNGVDDDCSGVADGADVTDASIWYADRDADGWGDAARTLAACDVPVNYAALSGDCDDTDASAAPDATETCDDADNDCDGDVDEPDAVGAPIWYLDADLDGYGDAGVSEPGCSAPSGYVARSTDCDDTSAEVSPVGTELCNGVDDDCDSTIDEDAAIDALTWYADTDQDGYGDLSITANACTLPTGFVANSTDCDDGNGAVSPGDTELCNLVDDDCDAAVDEPSAADAGTWYADVDEDGYGDAAVATLACTAPADTVADGTDCNDTDDTFHPGATEATCSDPNDYNCDGSIGTMDVDADGWIACEDCDDGAAGVSSDAAELCNGVDDDCDGMVDGAAATGAGTWYADVDADGYGDPSSVSNACTLPSGYVTTATDCDDTSAAISPAGVELCATSADDDCDGDTDELRTSDCTRYYLDFDEDGFGSTSSLCACSARDLFTTSNADDCDDGDPATNPDMVEVIGNGADDDCDGVADASYLYDAPTILLGGDDNDHLGGAVAMGDVDGDGYVDLLVGAYSDDSSADNAGAAYLVLSGTTGEIAAEDADGVLLGDATDDDAAGYSVSIGDLDADGYGDLLIGGYGNEIGGRAAGGVYILYGPVVGVVDLGTADALLTGSASSDHAGTAVCAVGDTDGDGTSEVLVGATGADTLARGGGSVYVYGGAPLGTSSLSTADAEISGDDANDALGGGVAAGGDVNGDGFADVLLGADNDDASGSGAGTVYIFEGPLTTGSVSGLATATLTGESAGDAAGSGVSSAGDVDGDGYDDVLAGAPNASTGGRVYLVYGPFSGALGLASADLILEGTSASEAGYSVASAGDIDGDGTPDLLAGGYGDATIGTDSGATWLISGTLTGSGTLPGDAMATWFGLTDDSAGVDVAGGGDFDGDGTPDILVGAWNADPDGIEAGAAYLLPG